MSNPFSLEGNTILITGASSGIGASCAKVLSDLGARLILLGRNEERLRATQQSLSSNVEHHTILFDLLNTEDISVLIQNELINKGIKLDGVIHSVGTYRLSPVRALDTDFVESMLKINYTTGVVLLKACMNKRVSNIGASFVFISSVAGMKSSPGNAIYASIKAALNSFVMTSARELAPKFRVNSIAPGLIKTPLLDDLNPVDYENLAAKHLLGVGKPEDVAYGAAYFLSDAAKWITGTNLVIDGGFNIY